MGSSGANLQSAYGVFLLRNTLHMLRVHWSHVYFQMGAIEEGQESVSER
jgi:hypothetical protein